MKTAEDFNGLGGPAPRRLLCRRSTPPLPAEDTVAKSMIGAGMQRRRLPLPPLCPSRNCATAGIFECIAWQLQVPALEEKKELKGLRPAPDRASPHTGFHDVAKSPNVVMKRCRGSLCWARSSLRKRPRLHEPESFPMTPPISHDRRLTWSRGITTFRRHVRSAGTGMATRVLVNDSGDVVRGQGRPTPRYPPIIRGCR